MKTAARTDTEIHQGSFTGITKGTIKNVADVAAFWSLTPDNIVDAAPSAKNVDEKMSTSPPV